MQTKQWPNQIEIVEIPGAVNIELSGLVSTCDYKTCPDLDAVYTATPKV